jgi:uncharacterized YccA/Bax inhibitor family protein
VFSILVVIVAALNLLLDFSVIEHGMATGAPRAFSWFAAFGLMVTIIWLYIELHLALHRVAQTDRDRLRPPGVGSRR